MKQRISAEQLKELNPSQKKKLREWSIYGNGLRIYDLAYSEDHGKILIREQIDIDLFLNSNALPLLSIGQCIELLVDKNRSLTIAEIFELEYAANEVEIIDELWKEVKSIL